MYADYLRDHGFNVTEIDSTDAGLLAAHGADLVITGVRVAGSFDGIELVRRLRHSDLTKATPLIVLTACAFEPDQARAFAAGCDVFLPKPCLPEVLLAETWRLIDQARELKTESSRLRARGDQNRQRSKALLERSDYLVAHGSRLRKRRHR